MKFYKYFFLLLIISVIKCSCKTNKKSVEEKDIFDKVLMHIEQNGDFVNQDFFPTIMNISKVIPLLDSNSLVIDLRAKNKFKEESIPFSVNINYSDIIDFFETQIESTAFSHIFLVCYTGEKASYANSLLRILGYSNTYTVRYGASSFSKKTAQNKWLKNISSYYENSLETHENSIGKTVKYPILLSAETNIYSYLRSKAKKLLQTEYTTHKLSAKELFENSNKYYIISYYSTENKLNGHIPSAINYIPKQSFHSKKLLNTLPTNKPIAIYCNSGHQAAFLCAYLHLLGYDAHSVAYGASSFMHNTLLKKGKGFTEKDIFDMQLDKINYIEPNPVAKLECKPLKGCC